MNARRTLAWLMLLAGGAAMAHGGVRVEIGVGPAWGWGAWGGWGWYRPWVYAPPPVVWVPAPVVPAPPPRRREPMAPRSVGPTLPDPVITARQGQDPNQTEYDRQRCNRWAVTQQAALADAAEFQRTVARCLDGLGYTMK